MAKFYGKVGYAITTETSPGVWTDDIVEKEYYGDCIRVTSRWQKGSDLNDDLTITNKISIIADAFANQNFSLIKYVWWMGVKWKVSDISVERPRLILSLGGVYNE